MPKREFKLVLSFFCFLLVF